MAITMVVSQGRVDRPATSPRGSCALIHWLRQRATGKPRLVWLLCLAVVLQALWCCSWHVHTSPHEAQSGIAHLGHHEGHADFHADAVEIEPSALLKVGGDGVGLILALTLLLLPRPTGTLRVDRVTRPPRSHPSRLLPPGRAPPLA